ncbi:hypothetical protein [Pseudoalteromonas sp. T1lg23B]|uniref:hypothetical protein n=1 Tax=Pseudoalteromonas sp. T1lg23B TaxID=2077097 RepID=UPI000CF6D1FE|nr:hypothetical protein [Pseudoalteromonas sp. T1lg23B]
MTVIDKDKSPKNSKNSAFQYSEVAVNVILLATIVAITLYALMALHYEPKFEKLMAQSHGTKIAILNYPEISLSTNITDPKEVAIRTKTVVDRLTNEGYVVLDVSAVHSVNLDLEITKEMIESVVLE